MITTPFRVDWRAAQYLVVLAAVLVLPVGQATAQVNQTLHYDGWILAAAHAPGLEGAIWRTDLWIHLDDSGSGPVTLRFCRSNTDNTGATEHTVDVPPGKYMLFFEDVVEQFLGVGNGSWVGAIHYTSNTPIQVWARIYSINQEGTASFGQLVEGIPTADMSPDTVTSSRADDHQWIYAVRHTADGRFRVNFGLVNPTAVAGAFRVEVFTSEGDLPPGGWDTRWVSVPPFSMVQLSDPYADLLGGDWDNMMFSVLCDTEGSGSFAYASVVDNATNDAFFVRGVKRKNPGAP